jgi:hypothetical protein
MRFLLFIYQHTDYESYGISRICQVFWNYVTWITYLERSTHFSHISRFRYFEIFSFDGSIHSLTTKISS